MYSAGIQGNVTVHSQNVDHVQDDGFNTSMPPVKPPIRHHTDEKTATTHTYKKQTLKILKEIN